MSGRVSTALLLYSVLLLGLVQGGQTPTRPGAPVDLEAGPAPVQQTDATDKHMEEFFKEVTAIKVCLITCNYLDLVVTYSQPVVIYSQPQGCHKLLP